MAYINKNEFFINEALTFMRDLKLSSLLQNVDVPLHWKIQIKTPKREVLSFLYKSYRKIDELSKLGGIITGSRALKFYSVRGVPLLDRKVHDWDILLDKDSFYKFCADNKLNKIKYGQDRISINLSTGIYVGKYGYCEKTPSYLFRHDIDIIAKDELPPHIECDGYKISSLESIMNEKINIIKKHDSDKHIDDCVEIMSKVKAYSDMKSAAIFALDMNRDFKNTVRVIKSLIDITDAESK